MSELTTTLIETALKQIPDSYLKKDLFTTKAVKNIQFDDKQVVIDIQLGFPAKLYQQQLVQQLQTKLQPLIATRKLVINITWQIVAHAVQPNMKHLPEVKNIIAVASGKGGVGKSTTAVNIALALQAEGARVGILDADIYGPNQPQMLGIKGTPETTEDKKFIPVISHQLQAMSIGLLIDKDTPMVWRGPMATSALQQLLYETQWQNLDYLIIDLPPGTGDIQLTLAQKIPVSGAVIVTTPQEIALLDVRKAINMFEKVRVPILGIVENMSLHTCSHCGHQESIFGEGGGQQVAQQFKVDLLGSLPLAKEIREQADSGNPTVAVDVHSALGKMYRDIALGAAAKLALQAKDYAAKFPTITVEDR